MQQHMHTSKALQAQFGCWMVFCALDPKFENGLASMKTAVAISARIHDVFSFQYHAVLQNIKACKESVLEAAQLYVDEHDDEKVQQTSNIWHKLRLASMRVPAVQLCCLHARLQVAARVWHFLHQHIAEPQPQIAVLCT
jgi:hypothetical protein